MRLAARQTEYPRAPGGDEAGKENAGPRLRRLCRAGMLQLPAQRRAVERRGAPEGRDARAGLAHHGERGSKPRGRRRRAGRGPRGLFADRHRAAVRPSPGRDRSRRGHGDPGRGGRDRDRAPLLRRDRGEDRRPLPGERPALLRRRRADRHARERGYGQRLFRLPLRQGDSGLCKLSDGQGRISRLCRGAGEREGSAGARL